MAECRICKKKEGKYELSTIADICRPCALREGLAKPMPSLRPNVPCRRCEGTVFVRALLRSRDRDEGGGGDRRAPIAAVRGFDGEAARHFGRMEGYVCRACGFTELYAREPREIPIGPEFGTELIEVGGEGPYR
jgi:hypothetical protein